MIQHFKLGGKNMDVTSTQKNDADFVINSKINREFSIVYHGNSFDRNVNNCVIPVKSRREVELLLLSLREEASVIMNEQERKLCNLWDWLYGRTYSDIFTDLKWSYREQDEVLDIIEKIPLPRTLSNSFLKIDKDDPEPERIDPAYVHKKSKKNVLISKPYQYGNMFYFNGFTKSSEIKIDHSSDHLEGIVIFEAFRQAGIASAHLAGMPFSGALVILKTTTRYTKFVECGEPFLIRTIPAYKQRGGVGFCVYNLVQKGTSCAAGHFSVIAYNSKNTYAKFRNGKFIDKTSNGNKTTM
jgi:hypothetical protein